jgi:FkbM family methyltransferase
MEKIEFKGGWWIPKYDAHYEKHMADQEGIWDYQSAQRKFALESVESFDIAIDVGANVGFWSKTLCTKFRRVVAFEPLEVNSSCLQLNLAEFSNWSLKQVALSDSNIDEGTMFCSSDESGNAGLSLTGVLEANTHRKLKEDKIFTERIEVRTLDSYFDEFLNQKIGFIKVDCQGYELEILRGAKKVLTTHAAVLCLELPRRNLKERIYYFKVRQFLMQFGYRKFGHVNKDTVFKKSVVGERE